MSLAFMGGLAGAFMKGYDQTEDREIAKKAFVEDRAFQKTQREFQNSQNKRTTEEQQRDDAYRTGMQGVQTTTETIDVPATQTVYGKEERVVRDQNGNLMPGAVETPAQKTVRQRNRDDILADYAAVAKKAGKHDLAMKFDEQAELASHQRSAELFRQWDAATPADGDLMSAVKQAQQIYNGDRLPGKIEDFAPAPDGKGVVLRMANKLTGQAVDLPIKDVADLKQRMEAYFSKDTYNAYTKAKREAAVKSAEKIAEERAKGHVVPAGGAFVPGAGDTRQPFQNDTGYVPATDADGNPILGPDGQPTMVKPGTRGAGAGAGGAGKVPDVIKETLKGNESMISSAAAISDSLQSRYPQFKANPLQAHNIAINAAKGVNMEVTLDPQTGLFNRHYNDVATKDEKGNDAPGYFTGQKLQIDSQAYRKGGTITDKQAADAVQKWSASSPDEFKKYAPAASKDGLAALNKELESSYQAMEARASTDMAAAKKEHENAVAAKDPKAAAAAIDRQRQIQFKLESGKANIDTEATKIALVRDFYKPGAAGPGAGNGSPAKPAPTAAERLKNPGGLGAAPQAAMEKLAQQEAEQAKVNAQKKADSDARSAAHKQQVNDLQALTPQLIRLMAPEDALDRYTRYGNLLSPAQKNELLARIPQQMRPAQ